MLRLGGEGSLQLAWGRPPSGLLLGFGHHRGVLGVAGVPGASSGSWDGLGLLDRLGGLGLACALCGQDTSWAVGAGGVPGSVAAGVGLQLAAKGSRLTWGVSPPSSPLPPMPPLSTRDGLSLAWAPRPTATRRRKRRAPFAAGAARRHSRYGRRTRKAGRSRSSVKSASVRTAAPAMLSRRKFSPPSLRTATQCPGWWTRMPTASSSRSEAALG